MVFLCLLTKRHLNLQVIARLYRWLGIDGWESPTVITQADIISVARFMWCVAFETENEIMFSIEALYNKEGI